MTTTIYRLLFWSCPTSLAHGFECFILNFLVQYKVNIRRTHLIQLRFLVECAFYFELKLQDFWTVILLEGFQVLQLLLHLLDFFKLFHHFENLELIFIPLKSLDLEGPINSSFKRLIQISISNRCQLVIPEL